MLKDTLDEGVFFTIVNNDGRRFRQGDEDETGIKFHLKTRYDGFIVGLERSTDTAASFHPKSISFKIAQVFGNLGLEASPDDVRNAFQLQDFKLSDSLIEHVRYRLKPHVPFPVAIDSQQLAELGILMYAAGEEIDAESILELLDGYGATDEELQRLSDRLSLLAELVGGNPNAG